MSAESGVLYGAYVWFEHKYDVDKPPRPARAHTYLKFERDLAKKPKREFLFRLTSSADCIKNFPMPNEGVAHVRIVKSCASTTALASPTAPAAPSNDDTEECSLSELSTTASRECTLFACATSYDGLVSSDSELYVELSKNHVFTLRLSYTAYKTPPITNEAGFFRLYRIAVYLNNPLVLLPSLDSPLNSMAPLLHKWLAMRRYVFGHTSAPLLSTAESPAALAPSVLGTAPPCTAATTSHPASPAALAQLRDQVRALPRSHFHFRLHLDFNYDTVDLSARDSPNAAGSDSDVVSDNAEESAVKEQRIANAAFGQDESTAAAPPSSTISGTAPARQCVLTPQLESVVTLPTSAGSTAASLAVASYSVDVTFKRVEFAEAPKKVPRTGRLTARLQKRLCTASHVSSATAPNSDDEHDLVSDDAWTDITSFSLESYDSTPATKWLVRNTRYGYVSFKRDLWTLNFWVSVLPDDSAHVALTALEVTLSSPFVVAASESDRPLFSAHNFSSLATATFAK